MNTNIVDVYKELLFKRRHLVGDQNTWLSRNVYMQSNLNPQYVKDFIKGVNKAELELSEVLYIDETVGLVNSLVDSPSKKSPEILALLGYQIAKDYIEWIKFVNTDMSAIRGIQGGSSIHYPVSHVTTVTFRATTSDNPIKEGKTNEARM